MCGRINVRMSSAELTKVFNLMVEPNWLQPRFNLAPTQQIPTVRLTADHTRYASPMKWGLIPTWAKDPKIGSQAFNARAETIAEKPMFRTAFKRRRCLIPVSGFYEWQKLDSKTKQPWNIFRSDGGSVSR